MFSVEFSVSFARCKKPVSRQVQYVLIPLTSFVSVFEKTMGSLREQGKGCLASEGLPDVVS